MHKVSQHMQTTIALRHASTSEGKKSPGTLSSTVRAVWATFHAEGPTLNPVARASRLFSAREPPFARTNTMFCANPIAFKSQPWCSSSNAICQQWLATLLFSTLLNLYPYSTSTLPPPLPLPLLYLYSALLYSTLLRYLSTLFYSTHRFSSLRCSALLCSSLLHSAILCSTLLFPSLLYSALLCSTLLFSTLPLLCSTLLCLYSASTLPLLCLYSTLPLLYIYSTYTLPLLYATSTLPPLYFTQVPTGHNDLWASENVTSWSLKAHANWTQWSLG